MQDIEGNKVYQNEDHAIKEAITLKALTQPSPYPPQDFDSEVAHMPEQLLRYFVQILPP